MNKNSKFIKTEFENYFSQKNNPWGTKRPALYQHNDLIDWKGLPMFATDFNVDKAENVIIEFTCLGCAVIYINGKRIGTGELDPGWSAYEKRTLSKKYDITEFVNKGKNRILAVTSAGWYTGRISGERHGFNPPAFRCEITENGNEILATDENWLADVGGQIRTADFYDGEFVDARVDDYSVISKTDYELKDWEKAVIFDYNGETSEFIGPEVRVRPELSLKPQIIKIMDGVKYNGSDYGKATFCNEDAKLPLKIGKGHKLLVDIGQESVGWLKFDISADKNTKVKIRYAEFLNDSGEISRGNDGPEGSVYTINYRSALAKSYYIFGDNKDVVYRPTFTFFGYRYAEITVDGDVEFRDITAEIVGNDTEEIGKIETSSPMVNKLISNTIWGQRSNYLSVPTDCPQRDERLGWTGDAQAFSITAAYNADVYGFFRKWMQDMRDSQSESGGYADVNPRVSCCTSEDACAWADAGIIIPYNLYKLYGDKTMLQEHYDSMDKYVTSLVEKYQYAGPIPRYGDWLAYDWCDNKFVSSCYFVHDCDIMIYVSELLGKADKVCYYKDLKVKALNYFKDNFMKDGKIIEQTQTNKILPLAFDMLDEEYSKEVADELEKQIAENGDRLSCGFLGTYNLCPTLSKYGKDKTAYNLLLQRNEPSWLYSIDQGATTIWERWNSYTKEKGFGDVGMNSFNHYAYGAIVEWMYRFMAGIEAAEPGFTRIALNPRIDLRTKNELPKNQENITYVKASYKSVSGLIESEWTNNTGLVYKCSVPEGTTAILTLPAVSDKITMNGKDVTADCKKSDNKYSVELKPGKYTFEQ